MLKNQKKSRNEVFSENRDKATFQVFLMQVYNHNSLHYYLLETQIQSDAQKNTGSLNFNLLVFLKIHCRTMSKSHVFWSPSMQNRNGADLSAWVKSV